MLLQSLKKGDTVAIINPAFKNPTNAHSKYQKMVEYFESKEIKIVYGKSYTDSFGYLAGTDQNRADDIMEMFQRKDVNAIICMRGGYGASRIVDKLDYNIIKKNPKIFCGFSDITVLLNSIYQKTNMPTIHGLVSLFLGSSECDSFSSEDFWNILTQKQIRRVLKNPENNAKTLTAGVANGVLVGGNLSLIATLIGTPYEIDFTDKIVFIEDVGEEPYQIDRYLCSLRLSGMLDKAKGFVLGYFTDSNPSESRKDTQSYEDILKDYFGKLNKPVIYDYACGHSFPFINLPIGVKVSIDASNKTITIMEELYE